MKTASPDNSSFGSKGIAFFVFMSVLVLGGLFYFAANSPWIIKKVVDEFAPRYDISYDALRGNMLTGIEIETPRYRGEPLADRIALKWNPNMLLHKKIAVTKLQIEKANIDTIEKLISSFKSKTPREDSKPFDFTVDIGEISIGVD
ncbi:MAG: translocation and assembly module TamB, partial [Campylobacterota bacterium]|nr:translocation and assembly module TamB [Campylobacterota bacterium]